MEKSPSAEASVVVAGLMEADQGAKAADEAMRGAAALQRLKLERRLLKDRFWEQCTLFDVTFTPKRMSVNDLETGLEYLMGSLYTQPETERRKRDFLRRAREHRRAS